METLKGPIPTPNCDEALQHDLRLILQEHSGNVNKKWGNSKQWILELRTGRRVAIPIQISLPSSDAIIGSVEQN